MKIRSKYILSVISIILVTALAVFAPYGYNYINDYYMIENNLHIDGEIAYSEGRLAVDYEDVKALLGKSSPIWMSDDMGTVSSDTYEEIYSTLSAFLSAMDSSKDFQIMTFELSDSNNFIISQTNSYKVSGVVESEAMTTNLMMVWMDSTVEVKGRSFNAVMVYNRDSKKVYALSIYYDNIDDSEAPYESYLSDTGDIYNLYYDYIGCTRTEFNGQISVEKISGTDKYFNLNAFPEEYYNPTFS